MVWETDAKQIIQYASKISTVVSTRMNAVIGRLISSFLCIKE